MNDHTSGDNAIATQSNRAGADRIPKQLNLSIQQALGCLDIKLEDELNRFRTKQGDRTADRQALTTDPTTGEWQSDDVPDSEIITGEIVRSAIASPHEADLEISQSGGFIIIDGIYPPRDNLSAITRINEPHSSAPTDLAYTHESLDLNFSPRGEITSVHHEYSASSQELLRQIQSGYSSPANNFATGPQSAQHPPKKHKLFTPVKIGSLAAVVCVLAGGAAYTYFNPTILAPLTTTKSLAPTPTANSSLGQSIQSPNLAANEFTELNLSRLNTLKMPTATANPTTASSSIATPTPTGGPVAIPYNGMNTAPVPPTTIVSQPRLSDSLIRSLLPPNFHTSTKQTRYPAAQPGLRR